MNAVRTVLGVSATLLLVATLAASVPDAASVSAAASDNQSAEIEALKAKIRGLQAVISNQKKTVQRLQGETRPLKDQIAALQQENQKLEAMVRRLSEQAKKWGGMAQISGDWEQVYKWEGGMGNSEYRFNIPSSIPDWRVTWRSSPKFKGQSRMFRVGVEKATGDLWREVAFQRHRNQKESENGTFYCEGSGRYKLRVSADAAQRWEVIIEGPIENSDDNAERTNANRIPSAKRMAPGQIEPDKVPSLEAVLSTMPVGKFRIDFAEQLGHLNLWCQTNWCGRRVRTLMRVMQVVGSSGEGMLVGKMPHGLIIHDQSYGCVVYAKFSSEQAIASVKKGDTVALLGVIKGAGAAGWLYRDGLNFTWQPLLKGCQLVSPTTSELKKATSPPSRIPGVKLTEDQMKQVFWEIAKIEDAAFDLSYDPKKEDRQKEALARKWGLTQDQLTAIAIEGVKKKWKMPPPPKP